MANASLGITPPLRGLCRSDIYVRRIRDPAFSPSNDGPHICGPYNQFHPVREGRCLPQHPLVTRPVLGLNTGATAIDEETHEKNF